MKDLSFLKNWQYAHRGLHQNNNGIPENSITAYHKAIENNYGIELDISLSNDGEYFCYHDDSLKRLTNKDDLIANLSKNEIRALNLLNTKEKIPTFTEVLHLINSEVPVMIEIKSHKNHKLHLSKVTSLLDSYQGDFAVFSFDPKIVSWFKKNRPNYIRGQITSYFYENKKMPFLLKFLMRTLFFNHFTKPDFISYNLQYLPNKYASKAKKKGLLVFGYTARNQSDFDLVLKTYDNVVFENFIPNDKKNT
ncbi:MAG: glycerophosphodiester phosphodiesterase family protein [Acholeplasma sp.]|nr:glycerophosphodiester phosphodiesterase family protein [Acholeplasma sp.]